MSDRSVHPAFDPSTQTWFTVEPGLRAEAPSLEQLQRRLGEDVVITGYFPLGTNPPLMAPRLTSAAPAPPPFTTIIARQVQPPRPTPPPTRARPPGRLTPPTKPSAAREARLAVKPPAPPARAAVVTPPAARPSLPPPGMGSPEPPSPERLAAVARMKGQAMEDTRRRLEVGLAERRADPFDKVEDVDRPRRPHLAKGPAPCARCGEITDDEIAMVLETRGQVARKREYMQRYMKNLRRKRRADGAMAS